MKSRYLGIDISIPEQTILSGGEEVRIIPHSILEEVILNSEAAKEKNISVHYTSVPTNEPRHYVFLCSISDSFGRRIESIGESLDDTLDTTIARSYPALMAFKRAFDDAAIKYLGLEGKVYSDNQCSDDRDKAPAEKPAPVPTTPGPNFGDSDDNEEDAPSPAPAVKGEKKKNATAARGVTSFGAEDDEDDEPDPVPRKTNKQRREEAANERAQGLSKAAADFGGEPLDGGEEYEETPGTESTPAFSFGLGDDDEDDEYDTGGLSDSGDIPEPEPDIDGDEFDTVICCGKVKGRGFTIRTAYNDLPDTFYWLANSMNARTDHERLIQGLCQKYEKKMEG